MRVRVGWFVLGLLLTGLAPGARADQAAYVSREVADKAAAIIGERGALRAYCAPCGDSAYRVLRGFLAEVEAVPGTEYHEVKVQGEGVDLAYVYAEIDGEWTNLAVHLGLPVQDVPRSLEGVTGPLPAVWPACYAGALDGKHPVFVWLSVYDETVTGHYHYARIGTRLDLEGELKPGNTFEARENTEGVVTGTFEGRFNEDATAIEGQWRSADGERALPFTLTRIAIEAGESAGIGLAGRFSERTMNFPVLLPADAAWPAAVNAALVTDLRASRDAFADDYLRSWLPAYLPEAAAAADDSPSWEYAQEIGVELVDYSPNMASFLVTHYQYTGGAHGNTNFTAVNLHRDGDAAKPLDFAALFADPAAGVQAISEHCIAELKKDENAMWVVQGTVATFKAEELGAFTVSRGGLTVHFAPYAVGPYSSGAFQVAVPWDIVRPYQRPGLPESLFTE
jgi:hypothetical protein